MENTYAIVSSLSGTSVDLSGDARKDIYSIPFRDIVD
jgi:hypothetical protein